MKYYQDIIERPVFNAEFMTALTKSKSSAYDIIRNYRDKGYIRKIKHDLYATVSLENGGLIPSKYQIAGAINPTSFVSHHSSFEFHGFYNQVFNTVNVSSMSRFAPFDFDGVEYQYLRTNNEEQVELIRGVKVTSVERTIVDSVNDIDKVAGTEELMQCIALVPMVDENKMLAYLNCLSSKLLYKKVGHLLSYYQKELRLSDRFLDTCMQQGGKVIGYFSHIEKSKLKFDSKWGLYAYDYMTEFNRKKDDIDV